MKDRGQASTSLGLAEHLALSGNSIIAQKDLTLSQSAIGHQPSAVQIRHYMSWEKVVSLMLI